MGKPSAVHISPLRAGIIFNTRAVGGVVVWGGVVFVVPAVPALIVRRECAGYGAQAKTKKCDPEESHFSYMVLIKLVNTNCATCNSITLSLNSNS